MNDETTFKVGDCVLHKILGHYRIGTILSFHNISEGIPKSAKICWITTDDYPVSVRDFYEDYMDLSNPRIHRIVSIADIPDDFYATNYL